jgi:hypothetical protein
MRNLLQNGRLFNLLMPELNPSPQRCLPRFFTGDLIFKGLTERRLYKSFGVIGLKGGNSTGFVFYATPTQIYTPAQLSIFTLTCLHLYQLFWTAQNLQKYIEEYWHWSVTKPWKLLVECRRFRVGSYDGLASANAVMGLRLCIKGAAS